MKAHTVTAAQHTGGASELVVVTPQDSGQTVVTVNGAPVEIYDRVVDLLDTHRDVGIIDTADGASILDWRTTSDFAHAIATDPVLAELIRRQELGGAA